MTEHHYLSWYFSTWYLVPGSYLRLVGVVKVFFFALKLVENFFLPRGMRSDWMPHVVLFFRTCSNKCVFENRRGPFFQLGTENKKNWHLYELFGDDWVPGKSLAPCQRLRIMSLDARRNTFSKKASRSSLLNDSSHLHHHRSSFLLFRALHFYIVGNEVRVGTCVEVQGSKPLIERENVGEFI